MKRVIIAGSIVLDIILTLDPAVPRKFEDLFRQGKTTNIDGVSMYLGGEVGNTGLAMHKLGLPVQLVSKVGNDRIGRIVRDILAEFGTDARISVVDDVLSSAAVAMTPPGMDKISFFRPGAAQTYQVEDTPVDLLRQSDLFHFGYPPAMKYLYANNGDGLEALFKLAKSTGITTSVDMTMIDLASEPGKQDWNKILTRMLPYVDIYLPSIEETLFMMDRERYLELAGRAGSKNLIDYLAPDEIKGLADKLLALGPSVVVIKMGKKGLYLRTADANHFASFGRAMPADLKAWAGREIWCEAIDTWPIVSTTGAGDTAIAGFLASLLHGATPEKALQMASLAASLCIGSPDTVSRIENYDKLEKLLTSEKKWLSASLDNQIWRPGLDRGIFLSSRDQQ